MGYMPTTRSGHNMFDMASLLQKAIRRGDAERAGYAAYELLGSYDTVLWKRLLVISAEDTWGVITKEVAMLYQKHIAANKENRGYGKDPTFVSEAVDILCRAKKSRDACYYACNFILSNNQGTGLVRDDVLAAEIADALDGETQLSLADGRVINDRDYLAAFAFNSIRKCDMENSGAAIRALMEMDYSYVWKLLSYAGAKLTEEKLSLEIRALMFADDFVNKKKKVNEKDPIFLSKLIMNIMYFLCGKFETVCSERTVTYDGFLDWSGARTISVSQCRLPDGIIPEYVYDVHTIRGKRNGKTDWGMNLVENDALYPFQKAFFEEGSWELRYDYKHEHGLCSEKEYHASLEYRKTHVSNPARALLGLK